MLLASVVIFALGFLVIEALTPYTKAVTIILSAIVAGLAFGLCAEAVADMPGIAEPVISHLVLGGF